MTDEQQKLYDKLLKKVNEYCLGQAAEDAITAIDALVDNYETQNAVSEFLLEDVRYYFNSGQFTLKDIIQRLRAVDIIKKKILDINYFSLIAHNCDLTSEEQKFLEEVLKWKN